MKPAEQHNPDIPVNECDEISRRAALGEMRSLFLIATGLSACSKRKKRPNNITPGVNGVQVEMVGNKGLWIDPLLIEALGPESKKIIVDAFNSYHARYGFEGEVHVFKGKLSSMSVGPSGRVAFAPEYTEGRNIELRPMAIKKHLGLNALGYIVRHALTHAQKPEKLTQFSPFTQNSGGQTVEVYGAHGLFINARLPNGKEVSFKNIEEGVCETLAYEIDRSYKTNATHYLNLHKITLAILKKSKKTPLDLIQLVRTNDIWGFIKMATGSKSPSEDDLHTVVRWYTEGKLSPQVLERVLGEIK